MNPKINFSGFLQQGVLFSLKDLEEALTLLEPFEFYNVSSVQTSQSLPITQRAFLQFYKSYLSHLFEGTECDESKIAMMFSHAIASDSHFFVKMELPGDRFLFKPKRSVIQLQPLGLFISSLNQEIHTKTFAKDAQSFGLKWNFPTIYEDAQEHKIHELTPNDSEFQKFTKLRQFIRHHTQPLIVTHAGEKKVYTFRYSKDLKDQISKMKFFTQRGLEVVI
jgi:hypothetical protein